MTPETPTARGWRPGPSDTDNYAGSGRSHHEGTAPVGQATVVDFEAAVWRRAARRAWAHLVDRGLANPISYAVLFGDERRSA